MFGFVFIFVFDYDESKALSHLLDSPWLCWIKVESFDSGPYSSLSLLRCFAATACFRWILFLPVLSLAL